MPTNPKPSKNPLKTPQKSGDRPELNEPGRTSGGDVGRKSGGASLPERNPTKQGYHR